jgi:hypothetical protein
MGNSRLPDNSLMGTMIREVKDFFNYFSSIKTLFSIKEPLKAYFDEDFYMKEYKSEDIGGNNDPYWVRGFLHIPYWEREEPGCVFSGSAMRADYLVFKVERRRNQYQILFLPGKWIYHPDKDNLEGDIILIKYKGIEFYLRPTDYTSFSFDNDSFLLRVEKEQTKLEKIKASMTPGFFENAPPETVEEKRNQIAFMEKSIQEFQSIITETNSCNEHRKLCLEFLS